ncbi:MAG TPA: hypothetical protein VLT17_14110 [Gemmatimonadales bacterium]|jgi:hypothetical protein|nr:hypothetical protein [Gemmatimonadales bacterium]
MRKAIWTAALVGLASGMLACGGGSEAGLGPPPTTVDGNWNLTVTNLHAVIQGATFTCNLSGTTLSLTQTGTSFSGSYSGGTMTCTYRGQNYSVPISGTGTVINGTLNGNAVTFDLDDPSFHFTGTAVENHMSGSCVLQGDLGPPIGLVTLNGTWQLSR